MMREIAWHQHESSGLDKDEEFSKAKHFMPQHGFMDISESLDVKFISSR